MNPTLAIVLMVAALVFMLGAWAFWCAADVLESLANKILLASLGTGVVVLGSVLLWTA